MSRKRCLFISSNGTGMGHLTRLLAYARHGHPDLQPYFFSLSQAAPVVGSFGFPYEYLASQTASGLAPRHWHEYLSKNVIATIDRIAPAVVVFDGSWPYEGLRLAQNARPDLPWVWSRRGMWKRGVNVAQVDKAAWFDAVVEPGDFAASVDQGATATAIDQASRVRPVTLLSIEHLDDRATARKQLGLEPTAPHVLVTLGAGTVNDISADVAHIVAAARRLGVEVCVTSPEIADRSDSTGHAHLNVVSEFPLSRYLRAFDVAVSAAGYNSFHELLRFGVPTLFVPNGQTLLDDQFARAAWASKHGLAHVLAEVSAADVSRLLSDLLTNGSSMVARIVAIDPGNGAADAARVINSVCL